MEIELIRENEYNWKLTKNKNWSCIKLKMEVHSRNQYTLMIYLEIKLKRKLNGDGNWIKIEMETA